ncbi:unnamed protein product [Coregonus sp. 'balchen']|nr:unnamed protein product [Coregonus sp. 'balchen']
MSLPVTAEEVTIIIYLSVVGSLLLYMLFLLLVEPLIRKHDPYIQPLHNEEDSEVTIIIYLSVVGSLLLYMLFLLLVEPLIRKHDPYIQPLHNEEDSEDMRPQPEYAAAAQGGRGNTVLERVEGAQQRWEKKGPGSAQDCL